MNRRQLESEQVFPREQGGQPGLLPLPQHSIVVQSSREADDLLAEAVAHEEHRVLCDVGHQCRRGALVEPTQTHLFVGGGEAVDETPVQIRKGLHLDLCRV